MTVPHSINISHFTYTLVINWEPWERYSCCDLIVSDVLVKSLNNSWQNSSPIDTDAVILCTALCNIFFASGYLPWSASCPASLRALVAMIRFLCESSFLLASPRGPSIHRKLLIFIILSVSVTDYFSLLSDCFQCHPLLRRWHWNKILDLL